MSGGTGTGTAGRGGGSAEAAAWLVRRPPAPLRAHTALGGGSREAFAVSGPAGGVCPLLVAAAHGVAAEPQR